MASDMCIPKIWSPPSYQNVAKMWGSVLGFLIDLTTPPEPGSGCECGECDWPEESTLAQVVGEATRNIQER